MGKTKNRVIWGKRLEYEKIRRKVYSVDNVWWGREKEKKLEYYRKEEKE